MNFFTEDATYTGPRLTKRMVKAAEAALGYRLPPSYVALLFERNGGEPVRRCYPMKERTSWAEDHIQIDALCGIGGEWGIDGTDGLGSADQIKEWGYPNIGVVICSTPSGGHDTVMLDYSSCGPNGEPRVVHVDDDRKIRPLAPSFAGFAAGLVDCELFNKETETDA